MQGILTPTRNELVRNMVWPDYRAFVGMNPSTLVHGIKSMKHLHHAWYAEDKSTSGKLIGAATHARILEGDIFNELFCVYEGRRDKRIKDYQAFLAEHDGKQILSEAENHLAKKAAQAVLDDPLAAELLAATNHEVSIFCEDFGLQCKGRVDGLGNGILLDVKGTTNAEKYAFGRIFSNLHYAAKMATYKRWAEKLGATVNRVVIICHEQEPPYDVAVVPVPEEVLDNAWPKVEKVLLRLRECIESDVWPGVADGQEYELVVPNWAMEDVVEFAG